MHRYLLLLLIVGLCFASNYVVNGDFEQALTVGWTQYSPDNYGTITRATNYHPDADYETYVYRYGYSGLGIGYDKLYQTVDIPITNIDFSAFLKLDAWDNGSSWCGAACALYYRDANNVVLGVTRICRYSAGTPWSNTATSHLIIASDTNWHSYSFHLEDELQNLSGVDAADVAKITVALIDTSYNC